MPALSKNRLAIEEVEGEEEGRRLGRESGRRSSDVVRAVVPSTRQGEKKTGDEEGRRRVLARRADDGDQIDQLLVRDCVS